MSLDSDELKQRARRLRREQTGPERALWKLLRDRRLRELKFRRQHRIEPFIVDFYCATIRLVIELDGESHADRGRYDIARQKAIQEQGYRVLRFSNDDVLRDPENVLLAILRVGGLVID